MITKPIQLTTAGYWQELERLFEAKELPRELCVALKELVNSHINKTIPSRITNIEILQAKEHLTHGIELYGTHDAGQLFQVVVYMPKPEEEDKIKTFFKLIPLYPGCIVRRLDEITG